MATPTATPSPQRVVCKAPVVTCSVTVETFAASGASLKATSYRNAKLLLGRNQFRDMILHLESGSTLLKFPLRDHVLHKRFMKEGKATIKLADKVIMISNAPPNMLLVLLKTLACKQAYATESKENKPLGPSAIRARLLSEAPNKFDEISPLTVKEYQSLRNGGNPSERKPVASTDSPVSSKKRKAGEAASGNTPKRKATGLTPKRRRALPAPTKLTAEQQRVMATVKEGHNVFFTGSAGTGKSLLLRCIVGALPPHSTAVTASTGVAACHLSGTTLHAFAGIGNGDAPLQQCIDRAKRNATNWRKCQHLVVDEISMVDGPLFEKLEAVARAIRNNDKPFGGIQLILSGDFLQLPPVGPPGKSAQFAFETEAWARCVAVNIELTEVRRQTDQAFIDILNEIRLGKCSAASTATLRATAANNLNRADGILSSRLCTHREDVLHINTQHLADLPGETKVFTAVDSEQWAAKTLDSLVPAPRTLSLKVGAQVMLLKNVSVGEGLVNGARGVVTAFGADGFPVVRWASGASRGVGRVRWAAGAGGATLWRAQLPLALAWAFSVHKAQGMTLQLVEMSLSRVFEAGQAYVALSRATGLQGLRVRDFTAACVRADPRVLRFYKGLRDSQG